MLASIIAYLLIIIEVLCSLLLVGVILLQRTKAQGAGMAFGAGVGESMFGSQVGNVLTRTTVILGIIFLVNTAVLVKILPGHRRASLADRIKDAPITAPAVPAPMPIGGGAPAPGDFGLPAEGMGTPAAPAGAPEAQPGPAESEAPVAGESAPAAPAAPPAQP